MSNAVATESRTKSAALEIAARSILESRAFHGTIAQVVSGRALDHHWQGLFQYAALRVGPERAEELLSQLGAGGAKHPEDGLHSQGDPARELYRRLRAMCLEVSGQQSARHEVSARWYWQAPDLRYTRRLAQLRRSLDPVSSEVAELVYARGLPARDVAVVMDLTLEQVQDQLQVVLSAVKRVWSEGARLPSHDGSPAGVLLEAFSLDRCFSPPLPRRRRAPMFTKGDTVAGRYEIEELLGSGAFADVYRARDRDVEGHTVALKMARTPSMDEGSVRIALRELQLLASVFHPSVVQLKDHGWHNGHLWFVMPLYRGQTLAARLRSGPLERAEARAIFAPLAEALATMHRAGILHQDIKPDNIFLADLGSGADAQDDQTALPTRVLPVLLDLGVAAKDAELVLAGTPAYLAPEVAARFAGLPDPAPVGPKSDVFALALTLRDALEPASSLEPPLASVDAFVGYRATRAPRSPAARAHTDLVPVFARWLHLSPDERPSAAEFSQELAALTAPKERAERRVATLRWAVPSAVALFSFFGLVVYGLSEEAATQRTEAQNARVVAARAQQRAASIKTDLAAQEARSKELEASIARLEKDYRRSKLTREQLASRLAVAEGELRVATRQVGSQKAKLGELGQAAQLRDQELATTRGALEKATREQAAAQRQADRLRGRLQDAREAHEQSQQQLTSRLAQLEQALEYSRSRIAELQTLTSRLERQAQASATRVSTD